MMEPTERPAWRRSEKCAAATCVEIAAVDGGYLIRDSKRPGQEPLSFTEEELAVFTEAFMAGEFRSQ